MLLCSAVRAQEPVGALEGVRADPKAMSVIFGALICDQRSIRAAALKEIAMLKKYAGYGGVINRADLAEQQQIIRSADEKIVEIKSHIIKWKGRVKPAACTSREVVSLLACHDGGACDARIKPWSDFMTATESE